MNKMISARFSLAPIVAAGLALLQLAGAGSAVAAANCIKGEHKPPFKIGWANIYSIPTWMKETTGTIEDMANELKKRGLVESLTIADAQGNANTQIQQIQSMIDAKLDAIIVDAGRHQSAVQQSSDQWSLEPRQRAHGGRRDCVREAGPQAC